MDIIKHEETVSVAATGTAYSFTFGGIISKKGDSRENAGRILDILMRVPNYTNDVTTTLTIKESSSEAMELYNSGAKARNADYHLTADIPCVEDLVFAFDLSGVAGGTGGDIKIKLYVEK